MEFNFNIDMLGAHEYKDITGRKLHYGMYVEANHGIILVRELTILHPPIHARTVHFMAIDTPIKLTVGIPPCVFVCLVCKSLLHQTDELQEN